MREKSRAMQLRYVSICLVLFITSTLVVTPPTFAAPPVPSAAFQEAMKNQASRVMSGSKDTAALVNDLRRIVLTGDPVAQFTLAVLLPQTQTEPGISERMTLLRTSAKAGCAGSAAILGSLLAQTSPEEGVTWIRRAAEGGDAGSQLFIAGAYKRGASGMSRNPVAAVAWAMLSRSQAYNKGMLLAIENMLAQMQSSLDKEQMAQADAMFVDLQRKYPKQPFYICGQSIP